MWETGGQGRPPLHTTAESVCVIPCHSEPSPQTGRGNPFPAPAGAELQSLPLRGGPVLTLGCAAKRS